jgi:hypothetical protein
MTNNSLFFAEVLSSNLTIIQAQCWDWKQPPTFGSLVSIESHNETIFGIISNIVIESSDPIRQPVAYQKTHAELLQEQPQIFEFLQTNFSAIIVGYQKNEQILYHLPSSPPQIHSFVARPSQSISKHFFKNADFLHLLAEQADTTPNFHEFLFAIIKQIRENNFITSENMSPLLKSIINLFKADYASIKTFINRVEILLA